MNNWRVVGGIITNDQRPIRKTGQRGQKVTTSFSRAAPDRDQDPDRETFQSGYYSEGGMLDVLSAPFTYEQLNAHLGQVPQSFLHVHNTAISRFFKRYLLMDSLAVFKWTLPDNWDADYFRYIIMGFGRAVIFKTDLFGVIPQYAELYGYNVFYRPNKAIVANPLIKARDLTIGVDCALIKLSPDYGSIADLVDYYGDLMALTYESMSVNILNSRLSYLVGVSSKAEADTFKSIYDEIASGKPAVFYRGKQNNSNALDLKNNAGAWETLLQNVKQSFIADELMTVLQDIRDEFLTHIGIPNMSERKKERINLVDSERNTVETAAKVSLWLEELQAGIDSAIKLFPELSGKLAVSLRFPPDLSIKGGVESVDG